MLFQTFLFFRIFDGIRLKSKIVNFVLNVLQLSKIKL